MKFFGKVQGGKVTKINFTAISAQIVFILHRLIQMDLTYTPAKNEEKILSVTMQTRFPPELSERTKLMIGNW